MTILSTKQARQRGMVALTLPLEKNDPQLFRTYKDMKRINGTEWAMVNCGFNRLEVWRRPSSTLRHTDKGRVNEP